MASVADDVKDGSVEKNSLVEKFIVVEPPFNGQVTSAGSDFTSRTTGTNTKTTFNPALPFWVAKTAGSQAEGNTNVEVNNQGECGAVELVGDGE
jgi:hypothetical protein